ANAIGETWKAVTDVTEPMEPVAEDLTKSYNLSSIGVGNISISGLITKVTGNSSVETAAKQIKDINAITSSSLASASGSFTFSCAPSIQAETLCLAFSAVQAQTLTAEIADNFSNPLSPAYAGFDVLTKFNNRVQGIGTGMSFSIAN